jgi:TPR repeat protein
VRGSVDEPANIALHPSAAKQAALAKMYAEREGVQQDDAQACKWSLLAAMHGSADARTICAKDRPAIPQRMTPVQVVEAEEQAQAWTEAFERRQKK